MISHLNLTDNPLLSNMPAQFNRILPLWKNQSSGLLFSPSRQPHNSQVAYARPTPNTTAATATPTTADPTTGHLNISGQGGITSGNLPSSRGTRPATRNRICFTRIDVPTSFRTILQPITPATGSHTPTAGKNTRCLVKPNLASAPEAGALGAACALCSPKERARQRRQARKGIYP